MDDINYELPQMKYPEQKGLVSIIIPIYNTKETYFRECLDSILAQTFTNWEAILVNDGSTNNIEKIVDEYVEKDSRFIVIHKKNEGTLLARKTGLENSKGEFIANIDHDDTYGLYFLEKMYAKITEIDADFVWCRCQIDEKGATYYVSDYKWNADISENIATLISRQKGANWILWNKLIKREIYVKVEFPDIYLIAGEDPIQMFQIACYSKSAIFVPENLYFHRPAGFASAMESFTVIESVFYINKILKKIFDDAIPQNVKKALSLCMKLVACSYFSLDKKQREKFKDEVESFLPEFIKHEKKLNLKICLLLASKGIEFPLKLREYMRTKVYLPIKKWKSMEKTSISPNFSRRKIT
jgi:glycosyltransferase involved in cell wall biosynthesis